MSKGKYYLTTPIYYVNAAPHIGTAYCTFTADLIKRFKIQQGYSPVVLTTGADEHGQNVERAARAIGKSPEEYATAIANEFVRQWQALGISYDEFIRTSDPKHFAVVQDLFERCQKNGYIYKGSYTGQYCFHDELYVNDAKPGDPCPDCGRITETVTEENYFFKLSAFQDKLLELYERQPDFIRPETRKGEAIGFVKQGLNDLSITRTTINWGIPVPVEGRHVFYVWFDALISYMSAVEGQNLWPADLHLIGKDILRFHAIYWPAFLMAGGLPLPKQIFGHGWILVQESKMSKSRGNVVRPGPIAQVMGNGDELAGADALRYFLWREIPYGQDGNFSYDALIERYNADLANGIGNLASRTLTMIHQYFDGSIPQSSGDKEIAASAARAGMLVAEHFENLEFTRGIEAVLGFVSQIDKFIVERAPWKLAKERAANPDAALRLADTLYTSAESLRLICGWLYPVMPASTKKVWTQLGMPAPIDGVRYEDLTWGKLAAGQNIGQVQAVFPRIDAKPAITKMQELEITEKDRQNALLGKKPESAAPEAAKPEASAGMISIDEFAKVDLRVGIVKSAEAVKGADKLLHLKVDIGEPEARTIVAGIALAYKPEELIGRKVVIVANLQPRKLRGLTSQGMIVAASLEGGAPVLTGFLEDVPVGARLK
ncbi:MAG TPA: methionine--tRNA ligase [Bryobacteraceae bacterium]|nr:methionine--tRNA ligase [Bryobacteraceae bacterium]